MNGNWSMTDSLGLRGALAAVMLVALSSGTGCSKVVDVGENDATEPLYATSAPPPWKASSDGPPPVWKIVDNVWDIRAVAAGGGRVFWIRGYFDDYEVPMSESARPMLAVQSCSVEHCKGSFDNIDVYGRNGRAYNGDASVNPSLLLNESGVFWLDAEEGTGAAHCSRDLAGGVSYLDPIADSRDLPAFGVDNKYLYLATAVISSTPAVNVVQRCEIADCTGTLSLFSMIAPPGEAAYDGASQIVPDGEYLYLSSGTRILRTRKDGTGDFEVIARDQQNIGAIAVRGDTVFWTESILLGRIQSCPISGCAGSPEVVVSNLHTPKELAVDDEYIYFTDPFDPQLSTDIPSSSDSLLRCPITGCSKPTRLAQKQGIGRFVVTDDEFVYFMGYDRPGLVRPEYYKSGTYIGVLRK